MCFTAYEATQKQREIERTIRKLKREKQAYKAAGLKEEETAVNARIRILNTKYKEFSKAAGLPEQKERMRVQYDLDIKEVGPFKALKDFTFDVKVMDKFSANQYIVDAGTPRISGETEHFLENLKNRPDRKMLTVEAAQSIIDTNKLTIFQSDRKTLKFLSDDGYAVINEEGKLITAVPEKLRKKYKAYLEANQNG